MTIKMPSLFDKKKKKKKKSDFKFIDLFAGIGGFRIAFENIGGESVFVSEWDIPCQKTYSENFGEIPAGDITKIKAGEILDFDVLTGGFPCQPFSQAGLKKGFMDTTRGTLFYDIARILEEKKPKAYFIENVRGLLNHDGGDTIRVMQEVLHKLGYSFHHKVIKASDFGLPTHRPRLYMVGFRNDSDHHIPFRFPEPLKEKVTLSQLLGGKWNKEIGYTLRVGGVSSGINDRRNWDTYIVDGKVRKITIKEAAKIMGFPDAFIFPVSNRQAMKQLGNSVAIPAIQATAAQIKKVLHMVK